MLELQIAVATTLFKKRTLLTLRCVYQMYTLLFKKHQINRNKDELYPFVPLADLTDGARSGLCRSYSLLPVAAFLGMRPPLARV